MDQLYGKGNTNSFKHRGRYIMQIKTTMNCHFSDWQKSKVLVVYCVGKDVGKLALGYITLLMEI